MQRDGVVECWSGGVLEARLRMPRENLICNLGQAGARGMVFETAAADIFAPEGPVQSQPPDGAGDVVGAAQNPAVDQDARADARADGQEDGVTAAFGDAAPRFAQDVAGPVAVDDDPDAFVLDRGQEFAAQRIILPAGNVRRPNPAGPGITDPRDGHTDGGDVDSFGASSGQEILQFAADQFPNGPALAAFEGNAGFPENLPVAGEERCGKLGASQVDSDDGHVGHDLDRVISGGRAGRRHRQSANPPG